MAQDVPLRLQTKQDVLIYVSQKSVQEKRPFKIQKSEPNRFCVVCTVTGCPFYILFKNNIDGWSPIRKSKEHSCVPSLPTVKKEWVKFKIFELFGSKEMPSAKDLLNLFHVTFGVEVTESMMKTARIEAKKELTEHKLSFGLVGSYL